MKSHTNANGLLTGTLLFVLASSAFGQTCESDYCIDWYSIDSGGVMISVSADEEWQLDGTIGQWDATEALELSGNGWQLTGGFWGVNLEELGDVLFRDRVEP